MVKQYKINGAPGKGKLKIGRFKQGLVIVKMYRCLELFCKTCQDLRSVLSQSFFVMLDLPCTENISEANMMTMG